MHYLKSVSFIDRKIRQIYCCRICPQHLSPFLYHMFPFKQSEISTPTSSPPKVLPPLFSKSLIFSRRIRLYRKFSMCSSILLNYFYSSIVYSFYPIFIIHTNNSRWWIYPTRLSPYIFPTTTTAEMGWYQRKWLAWSHPIDFHTEAGLEFMISHFLDIILIEAVLTCMALVS